MCMRGGEADCLARAADAFVEAVAATTGVVNGSLSGLVSGDPHVWGVENHHARFEHQVLHSSPLACLADRTVGHGGDFSTVNVGGFVIDDPAPATAGGGGSPNMFLQKHGPSYRHISDLSDLNGNSVFLNPPGQSGELLSDEYDSLLAMWKSGRYLEMKSANYDVKESYMVKPLLDVTPLPNP